MHPVPAALHSGVLPLQFEAQHLPMTQLPELHSALPTQLDPFGFLSTQFPPVQYCCDEQEMEEQTQVEPAQVGFVPEQKSPQPPQLVSVLIEVQVPLQHFWPEPQPLPQALQCASVPSETQAPLQQIWSPLQAEPAPHAQLPFEHLSAIRLSQAWSQRPQCAIALWVSAQVVPHSACPLPQPLLHA
jgi:hypothetical protein